MPLRLLLLVLNVQLLKRTTTGWLQLHSEAEVSFSLFL